MDILELEEKKERIYEYLKSKEYTPMKLKELAVLLQVPRAEKEEFKEVIDKLISEGKVLYDSKSRIKLAGDEMVVGFFSGTSKGYGFVRVEGEDADIFIPPDKTGSAHDKDKVLVCIAEQSMGRSREGEVVSILERSDDAITGTFQRTKTYGFVIPDNRKFGSDIFIPHGFTKGAVTGHKVVVEMTDFGGPDKNPEGHIKEIIGHIDDPGTDILSVIRAFNIPLEFPEGVVNELKTIPEEVREEDTEGRLDLRSEKTITIDSETAKDLDDAITITKKDSIYTLGVHIADVSQYVTENSPLDKEALKRGTSNYLIDSVIPMIPHELSNGICSLNQGTDRLAMSCIMEINGKGEIKGHRIAETVINVDRRMTYTNVQRVNDAIAAYQGTKAELFEKLSDPDTDIKSLRFSSEIDEEILQTLDEYRDFAEMFDMCLELSEILRARRHKRGSIDFDIPECEIIVDEKGMPIEIKPYDRNRATKIIEDFMLAANETVAEDYFWQEIPFVYRTHDTPDPEKITKLGIFINNFGYTIKMGQEDIHPKELQKLLEKIEGTDEEALISRLTLRSMKQAKYTVTCDGHFGLASKYYCHFTSPIRRYPDLQIHRIIKENLRGKLNEKRINHYTKILSDVAFLSSKCERRADEAEREVQKLKKIEFMAPHIGEVFDGVISGISTMGIYIELPSTVEGIVKIDEIKDDFYFFDEEKYALIGRNFNKTYKLGQRVKVKLEEADKLLRSIIFSIVEDEDVNQ
ncbi:MAG: RNB domain-containing ribonuclease [Lachnospiraceae bacterium]|nr:RNB domain-containing ribonuclease [Lachnospiraceae bacterium]